MTLAATIRANPPGLNHILEGLLIQHLAALLWALGSAVVLWLGGTTPIAWTAMVGIGWAVTAAWFVSRERRQTEEANGSNLVSYLTWLGRSFRDAGWPALFCGLAWGAWRLALR